MKHNNRYVHVVTPSKVSGVVIANAPKLAERNARAVADFPKAVRIEQRRRAEPHDWDGMAIRFADRLRRWIRQLPWRKGIKPRAAA